MPPTLRSSRCVFLKSSHNIADLKISFKHVFRPRKFGSCSEILYFRKYNRCSCSLSILESQQDLSLGRQVEDGVICDPSGDILLENVNFTVQPDTYTILKLPSAAGAAPFGRFLQFPSSVKSASRKKSEKRAHSSTRSKLKSYSQKFCQDSAQVLLRRRTARNLR